jgi:hypothetical protein
LDRTYSEQTLMQVPASGCMTSTIVSAIFTASSKYFLFAKLGGWKDDVGILRSISIGSGGLSAPTTTPSKRSPQPEASIRISFPEIKQSNAKP